MSCPQNTNLGSLIFDNFAKMFKIKIAREMFRQIALCQKTVRTLTRSAFIHSAKKTIPPHFDSTSVADTAFEVFNYKEYVQSRRNMDDEINLGKRNYYVYFSHWNGKDLLHIRHWFKNKEGTYHFRQILR